MPDWKKEALEAMAANRARQEAMWRRDNVGKVRLYLVSAPDDPPTFSAEYQADLRNVVAALRTNEIQADASFMTMDAVDATGGYIGEIAVLATQPVDKIAPAGFVAVYVTERMSDGAWAAAGETAGDTGDLGGAAALAGPRLLRPAAS